MSEIRHYPGLAPPPHLHILPIAQLPRSSQDLRTSPHHLCLSGHPPSSPGLMDNLLCGLESCSPLSNSSQGMGPTAASAFPQCLLEMQILGSPGSTRKCDPHCNLSTTISNHSVHCNLSTPSKMQIRSRLFFY